MRNYSKLLCICSAVVEQCSVISSGVGSAKTNVLCGDQRSVDQSEKPAAFQSKAAGQIGELFVYDLVFFEFFLISVDVFDVNGNSDHFACKKNKAVDQAVSRLRAH